mmetsp:Transcript_22447/g.65256  ORF Transcript_22447/g.65256 Transcript_22447/m.65256 type:complete len:294 (+) Transcript_22447:99-980(+)
MSPPPPPLSLPHQPCIPPWCLTLTARPVLLSEETPRRLGAGLESRIVVWVHHAKEKGVRVEVDLVLGVGDDVGDLSRHVQAAELHEARVLLDGLADELRAPRRTLSADNDGLLLLLGLVHNEFCTLRLLLSDLLALHSSFILAREVEVGNGHVLHDDVERSRALRQLHRNLLGDLLTPRQQLRGVVVRHHGLGHLVDDGGQHDVVVLQPEPAVDPGQTAHLRAGQHAQRDVHHLEVLRPCEGLDVPRPGPHVVDVRVLDERHPEMHALEHDGLADAGEAVPHDGCVATLHREE